MESEKREKLLWIDIIKVVSTLLIVIQHSIASSFTTLPVSGSEWKVINFIFMLSRMGVPVFVMCSGAGMLIREHSIREIWQKNIASLLKVYLGWMVVFGIRDVLQILTAGEHTGARVLVNAFLKCLLFGKYHTWFIFMLLGLYALTPFLYLIARKKELLVYFLLLSVLFTLFLPILSGSESLARINTVVESVHMQFVVGYPLYFLLGYFICQHMGHSWERYAEIVFGLAAAAAWLLSVSASVRSGTANQEAYDLFSPCGFAMCASFMLLFKKYIGKAKTDVVLNQIAGLQKYGIAVYLVHVLFVELWAKGSGIVNLPVAFGIWLLSLGIGMAAYRIPIINQVLFIRSREVL